MKRFAPLFSRRFLLPLAGLCVLFANVGCGRSASRPASSLTDRDRSMLDDYEQIRAGLADDDLRSAKVAAAGLVTLLKPTDASAPAPAGLASAQGISAAPALDRARQMFKGLSATMIPVVQGVEGFYVMTSPVPSAGDWIQRKPQVDNPYFGKSLRGSGELKQRN